MKLLIPKNTKEISHRWVRSIMDYEFISISSITEVEIPEGVIKIGPGAFAHFEYLTTITIPEGVTEISEQAFYCCSGLTAISLPDTLTKVGDCAFQGCYNLADMTIPESVTTIGFLAFTDCRRLQELIILNTLASENSEYWTARGLNPARTTIMSMRKLRNKLDISLRISEKNIEFSDSMARLMFKLMKVTLNISKIKVLANSMKAYDFIRSLLLVKKTLVTDIHIGARSLFSTCFIKQPALSINWRRLNERSWQWQNAQSSKTLAIPLNLFIPYLTVNEMQDFIVATELQKDEDVSWAEKCSSGCCIV